MTDTIVVAVTGATGRTGIELCKQLADRAGVIVKAAVHSPAKRALLPTTIEAYTFDSADPTSLKTLLRGAHALFLLTSGGAAGPLATQRIAATAKEFGIRRIVKLSSFDPHLAPQTPTDRWAIEAESMVQQTQIPCTLLRPPWFHQNFHFGYFTRMLRHRVLALPFGEGRSGWIDCRDVAAVAVKALLEEGHENKAYTLTGPEAISLGEIATILSRTMGQEIRYVPLSDEEWIQGARAAGFSEEEAVGILALMAKTRDGHITRLTDDVERILGRKPISFAQYADDHARELRALLAQEA